MSSPPKRGTVPVHVALDQSRLQTYVETQFLQLQKQPLGGEAAALGGGVPAGAVRP